MDDFSHTQGSRQGIKPRILLVYDYFDPAELAGGPIVSLVNIVSYLNNEFEFYIYTSNRDLDKSELSVDCDQWVNYRGVAKVFYGKEKWSARGYVKIIQELNPEVVYMNGV